MRRLPSIPSDITGQLAETLRLWQRQLNSEIPISTFSGSAASLSAITGFPGDLVMNVGSASTATRLWIHKGSTVSADTVNWSSVRIALG